MLTPTSGAGTETVRSGLVSTIVYFVDAVQSAAVMTWFILGMSAYPAVQKKCQEELDRVIGRSRMPTLADRDSLPYICATVREALRWRPVSPFGESLPKVKFITGLYPWLMKRRSTALYDGGKPSPIFRQITNILISFLGRLVRRILHSKRNDLSSQRMV